MAVLRLQHLVDLAVQPLHPGESVILKVVRHAS
jgi:hypothetical protein